jgi:hypothetical protein
LVCGSSFCFSRFDLGVGFFDLSFLNEIVLYLLSCAKSVEPVLLKNPLAYSCGDMCRLAGSQGQQKTPFASYAEFRPRLEKHHLVAAQDPF